LNEEKKIIKLKKKINNDDFRRREREIKEQRRQKKHSVPKKKKRKFKIMEFMFTAFLMYFTYTAFTQHQMLNVLNNEISEKKMKKDEIEKEAQKLKKDVEKMDDKEALLKLVEKIARDQYKMVKPNETIYIDKNKNENKLIKGIGSEKEVEN
jgi:cell division protein FtsB